MKTNIEDFTMKLLQSYLRDITKLDISGMNLTGVLDLVEFIYLKELNCSNNKITTITNITNKISYIDCSNNQIKSFKVFFPSLETFIFDNNPIEELQLPDYFNESFGNEFSQSVGSLPTNLKELFFGYNFNHQVEALPSSLIHLEFGSEFSQSVDNLPNGLTYLKFQDNFNNPVDYLPSSLTDLVFVSDSKFSQSIDLLPNLLTYLELGDNFNFNIDCLPPTLKVLILGNEFNQSIDRLPESLENLEIGFKFNQPIGRLPQSLKILKIGICEEVLYMREDILYGGFNHSIELLPDSIVELCLGHCFNQSINKLPKSLEILKIGIAFSQSFDNCDWNEVKNLKVIKLYGYTCSYYFLDVNTMESSNEFKVYPVNYNSNINNLPKNLLVLSMQINSFENKLNKFVQDNKSDINLIKLAFSFNSENNSYLDYMEFDEFEELFDKFLTYYTIHINYLPESLKLLDITHNNFIKNNQNNNKNKELTLFLNYGVVLIKFANEVKENINIQYLGSHMEISKFNSLSNNMRITFKKYFIKKIFDENNEEEDIDNNIDNENY